MKKREKLKRAMQMERKEHRSSFIVYVTLRILVIAMMILQMFNHNYENVFLCILTLILFTIPPFIQVQFRIELPSTLEVIILLFIFAAEILGEIREFYIKIPMWDTILHTVNGFLAAAIGFSMVDLLNRSQRAKFQLSPAFLAIVAFCFSMTIGVLWEFFEFGMDWMFGFDMQKDTIVNNISSVMLDPNGGNTVYTINDIQDVVINGESLGLGGYLDIGLIDTMKDLLVNFVGAVVFSATGYFYIKNRERGGWLTRFIPQMKKEEDDFLNIVEQEEREKNEREQEKRQEQL